MVDLYLVPLILLAGIAIGWLIKPSITLDDCREMIARVGPTNQGTIT